jgi:tetratricopeptide (TPR) repeat protein
MKKILVTFIFLLATACAVNAQKHIKLMNKGVEQLGKGNYNLALDYLNKSISKKDNYYLSYFNRAVAYFNMGDSSKMKSDLDNALRLSPEDYDCLELYARHYYRHSNHKDALLYANKALSINPSGYISLLISGEIYAIKDDYLKAEERIEKAYKLADEPCRVAPYLGSIKTLLNKRIEAKSYFDKCRNSVFYNEDYKMREALYYFTFNEEAKGEKLVEGIDPAGIKNKGFVRLFYYFEGISATQEGEYLRAVTLYNISQQYEEKGEVNEGIFLNRSICYLNLGELKSALLDINTYLNYNKSDTAYRNRALILEKMGDYKSANWSVLQAIKANPKDKDYYLKSSNLYNDLDLKDSAIRVINQGINAIPKAGVLYYQKAWLSQNDISYKKYIELVDSCLKYDLTVKQAVKAKTIYFMQTNQLTNANKMLLNAFRNGLDTSAYYFNKALIYDMNEDESMARKTLLKSVEFDSLNFDALYFLAGSYEDQGNSEKAILYYNKLINALPKGYNKGEYYRALGRIYTLNKESKMACKYYKLAIEAGEKVPSAMLKLNNCK